MLKDTMLAVRHFPDRKKPCLCIEQGNQCIVIAAFRNTECEELYKHFMNGMCLRTEMEDIFGTDQEKGK